MPAAHAVPDDAGGAESALQCVACGYDLRGVTTTCPECGAAVAASRGRGLLSTSDPAWVGTLASGARWLFFGTLLTTLGCLDISTGATLVRYASLVQPFAAIVCIGLATWKLTVPDAARRHDAGYHQKRHGARLLMLALLGLWLVWELATPSLSILASAINGVAVAGLGAGALWTLCVYLEHIAGLIPDDGLAKHLRGLRWTFVPALMTLVAGVAISYAVNGYAGVRLGRSTSLSFVILFVGILLIFSALSLWAVITADRLARRLRQMARLAADLPEDR